MKNVFAFLWKWPLPIFGLGSFVFIGHLHLAASSDAQETGQSLQDVLWEHRAERVSVSNSGSYPDPVDAWWKGRQVCTVLHENNQMRALRCTFPPGGGHEKHFHAPHFGYILKGGMMQITDAEGTEEVQTRSDRTWWSDGTDWHEVEVLGDETSEYLIIEPKGSGS